jgi:hypothetical protein
MHARTDAPRIFIEFKTHVECLLDRKIKCIQSDRGGEYQKIHNTFFCSMGIAHRALCAHAHVPIKFWDAAYLTALLVSSIILAL